MIRRKIFFMWKWYDYEKYGNVMGALPPNPRGKKGIELSRLLIPCTGTRIPAPTSF
jgi:hypothetical protein